MTDKTKQGIILAILAAVISGCSIFYNKIVIVKGIDPLIFNILKNGGVALVLTSFLLAKNKVPQLIRLSKTQWTKLIAIALIGGSIPFLLYFDALKDISALNANIIQKTLFIWVAMMAVPFLGERLSPIQVVGYMIVIWSNVLIGGFQGFTWSRPELMILIATMLWSVENVIARVALKDIDHSLVMWGRMFLGGIILLGIALYQGKLGLVFNITSQQLVAIIGSIAFLTAYVTSWYTALSKAPATLVTSILVLATPVTNVLSALFITHSFQSTQLINLVGTSAGVCLIAFLSRKFQQQETLITS